MIMTSHDREVMNRVVGKIIEIDGGQVRTYAGNYDFYEAARKLDAARREAEYERQQAMLAKEMRFIERFRAQAAKAAQVQSRVKSSTRSSAWPSHHASSSATSSFVARPALATM